MQRTDTQYLSKDFIITCDAAQKASFEDLGFDLQKLFHRCKSEADRLNTAKKILITLGVIVAKQGTPEEQAHFTKIKEIALSALSLEGQTDDKISRAKYFQDKLNIFLWGKKVLTAAGVRAHLSIAQDGLRTKFQKVFKESSSNAKTTTFDYQADENLSSSALSALIRINYLCGIETSPENPRPLTQEELLEFKTYSQHEDAAVTKIANDFTLIRKIHFAAELRDKSEKELDKLDKIGAANEKIAVLCKENFEPSQSLSAYYSAFDKYVQFFNAPDGTDLSVFMTTLKSYYDEHLTQLPAVHFAYRYFYNELTEVCSLFPNRIAAAGYKKAYEGYEGNVFPAPEVFQSIEAAFPEPVLPVAIEEEKKEIPSEKQAVSNKKSKNGKSKKNHSPPKETPRPQKKIKLDNGQTTSTSSTNSSTTSTSQQSITGNLKRDRLPFDEIGYDPRVSLWFTNPEDCLALPSYTNLSEETKKIALYKHTFPIALDQLVGTAYCVQESYQNSRQPTQVDILFSIPGEIVFVNGQKVRGLFQYCISGKDEICYHRYFKEIITSELLNTDQYGEIFEEAEFPPLFSQAASTTAAKKSADQELVFEPHLNTYAVADKSKGLIFRAFKARTLI
jgi:hypothetical protein